MLAKMKKLYGRSKNTNTVYFKQKWFCSKKLCCRLLYKLQKTENNEYKFEIKRKKNKNGNNVIQTLNNHKTIVMSS